MIGNSARAERVRLMNEAKEKALASGRTHKCFRRLCTTQVRQDLVSCKPCWSSVPVEIRKEIYATAGMHLLQPRRRRALERLQEYWETC